MSSAPNPRPPVTISLVNGVITVDKNDVDVFENEAMSWNVAGAQANDKIRIEFERKGCAVVPGGPSTGPRRGPFVRRTPTPQNPSEGVFERQGHGPLDTTPAECLDRWKYTITWVRPGGPPIPSLDPFVIIRTSR